MAKTKKYWQIQQHDCADKSFEIYDPTGELTLTVDYDDVDHDRVDRLTQELVDTLNFAVNYIPTKVKCK